MRGATIGAKARRGFLAAAAALGAACGGEPAGPGGPVATSGFRISLPVLPADTTSGVLGVWPFGVHGADHALDGHPGWDLEFRIGGRVHAAAPGTVLSVTPDINVPARRTVQLAHVSGGKNYRTVYTNVEAVPPAIVAGAPVAEGDELGTAGSRTQMVGSAPATWAAIHFQLDDFSQSAGLTNPNAVSPEPYLSPAARTLFDALWRSAAYLQEFCEPFASNPRAAMFPLRRAWVLSQGSLAAGIAITCPSPTATEFEYALLGADGVPFERGLVRVNPRAGIPEVDFRPSAGRPPRLGVYRITGGRLELSLGEPGAARPADLSHAAQFTTR